MIALKATANVQVISRYSPTLSKPNNMFSCLEDIIKLLKLSAHTKNLKLGKAIHCHLILTNQTAYQHNNTAQINSLINFYVKCGQVSVARQLFDEMPAPNVVSWSALMAGYLHNGYTLEVLRMFKCMLSMDYFSPNEYIATTVLSCCSDGSRFNTGKQCHGYFRKSGLVFHQSVQNALVHMYSSCFDVEGALKLFHTGPQYDLFSFNSVLTVLAEFQFVREAMEILASMVAECVPWDNVTYVKVFGLCSQIEDLKLGMQVHTEVLRRNLECDIFIATAMIDMYGKCGKIPNARVVFNGLNTQNVVSWTAMMAAYFQNGYFEEALNLFTDMELEGIQPNHYTYAVLLNSCAGLSALRLGDQFHACIEKSGYKDHIIVGNALINMHSKNGNIDSAYNVFSDMICRDSITWNTMISGFSHHGLGKKALAVFHDMMAAGESPNHITYVGVLSACAHLGLVQVGFFYFDQITKKVGIEPRLEHYTCIVALLSRAGRLDEAENFMKTSQIQWDVVAWRTLLNACHVHHNYGIGRRIADYVTKMYPNDVGMYTLLSNMYAKAKRWDGVAKIRNLMRERNIRKEPGLSWMDIRSVIHVFLSDDNSHPESVQIHGKVKELLAMIKPLGYVPDFTAVLHDVEDELKEGYLSYHSEKLAIAYGLMKTPPQAPIRVIKNLRMCDDCHTAVKLIAIVTNRQIIVRDANRFHHFQGGFCTCGDHW